MKVLNAEFQLSFSTQHSRVQHSALEKNNAERLSIAVRAKVPLAETDNCEVVIFRPTDGGDEHFCLLIGKSR